MQKRTGGSYGNCHKGVYEVKNPQKYIGNKAPIFRSQWEKACMSALDMSNKVVAWTSEQPEIPYIHPVRSQEEGRQIIWKYHPDFLVKMQDGSFELIEIKPSKQTIAPKGMCKGRSKLLVENETKTYAVNAAKWQQAIKFCEEKGWKFRIITEKTIGIYINSIR